MTVSVNTVSFYQVPFLASTVRLISSSTNGTAANGDPGGGLSFSAFFGQVYTPAVSTTGRYIAFKSTATNLVADDTNGFRDIFWKDTLTGTTVRIDVSSAGVQSNADDSSDALARLSISADGQLVSFVSSATNLVSGDTNGFSDVFVRNVGSGTTTRVSTSSSGVQGNGASYGARMSANGRYVAFTSEASNLVAGDTNQHQDIFVKDLQTNVTTSFTQGFNQFVTRVMGISNDGRYVLFLTDADNILPDNQGGVFLYDRTGGVFTRVNTATNGSIVNGDSIVVESYILSGDGRHVAFSSSQTSWGPADANTRPDVYVKNLNTGVVTLVSANVAGQQQNNYNASVDSISDDGRYVTFTTNWNQTNVASPFAGDAVGTQTYVKDTLTGKLTNITRNNGGSSAPGGSGTNGQISGDGSTVTFGVDYNSPVLPNVPSGVVQLYQTTLANADVIRDIGDNRTIGLSVSTSGTNYVYAAPDDYALGISGGVPVNGVTNLSYHFVNDYTGDFRVYAGDGASYTTLLNYQAIVLASSGNVTINAGTRDNIILASAEDNVITDAGGNNIVYAGAGNDTVTTGNGRDTIYGGSGNDNLLSAGGNDVLSGGTGYNLLNGGGGFDQAIYSIASSGATITHNADGSTVITGNGFYDYLLSVETAVFSDRSVSIRERARSDFDGNGGSDIVLQSGGSIYDWIVSNGSVTGGQIVGSAVPGWSVVGTGDFNGDGTSDVLLKNGGTIVSWNMQNGIVTSGGVVGSGVDGWTVVGTGDFNGDGTTDIALQNGGTVVEWTIQNGAVTQSNVVGSYVPGWNVVGTGDFNGDGTSDLLLKNGGTVVAWDNTNGAVTGGGIVGYGIDAWDVVGTGDFNNDGTTDVLLKSGGTLYDWIVKNNSYSSGNLLASDPSLATFNSFATGDYNGDGMADIALQSGNSVYDWTIQNGTIATSTLIGTTGGFVVKG